MSGTLDTNPERIRSALRFIPADDRDLWVRILMAIYAELGDAGSDLALEYSQKSDSFSPKSFQDVWRSAKRGGGIGIGTLFHEARERGFSDSDPYVKPTAAETAERQRAAVARTDKEHADKARKQATAATKAAAIWKAATPALADHTYLLRKGINTSTMLRELPADELAALAGYAPQSSGVALTGRVLIAPIQTDGKLSSLEFIDETGRKSALAGGAKADGYAPLQPTPEGDGAGLTLLIGEGIATCLSAAQATSFHAFAALSCGNLQSVATQLRAKYPKANFVILAELSKATGAVDSHSFDAAKAIGARVVVPKFGPDREARETDVNDFAARFGLDELRQLIEDAVPRDAWPEPKALHSKIDPEPYPIDALPTRILDAVSEVRAFVQAPAAMVATCALSALSLAIQAHVDIQRAERLSGPVGLFSLIIAESGERKSSCDTYFSEPVKEFEKQQREAMKPLINQYAAEYKAWESKQAGIKDGIRLDAKKSKSTHDAERALFELEQSKPKEPMVPRMIYGDATPEALASSLRKWPTGGVLSSEAGSVLGSHGMGADSAMRNLATLNQLWDGATLTIDRKTSESFSVRGARLTMGLQVQERTLREFLDKSGALARGSGFLARFLIAWPESTQGSRPFCDPPNHWPKLETFNNRLTELLNRDLNIDEDGGLNPQMLTMAHNAKAAWVEFYNKIELELGRGGELHDVKDVASKIADNVARLAALFHIFETGEGAVSLDAVERASRIAAWHLSESKRFFGELAQPQECADAARLDSWLIVEKRTTTIRDAQRLGPVRDRARLDSALVLLVELDRCRLSTDGKRRLITMNPALLKVTS